MSNPANPNILREANLNLVRMSLKGERTATKLRLAQLTGLSTVTVGAALDQLVENDEVLLGEMVPSNGGRPARSFVFYAGYRHALALYVRGNTLFIRVADLYGTCVYGEEQVIPLFKPDTFQPVIDRMLERYPTIAALGFGIPGVEREGLVTVSDQTALTGFPLSDFYQEEYGLPVTVENDVNLAVLGYCSRMEAESETVVYLYFPADNCPGSGLFVDGQLHRGRTGNAGEIKDLPPLVDWRRLDWGDFSTVCGVLTHVVEAFACILDPDLVVLHGPNLTETHRAAVVQACNQNLEQGFLPELRLSSEFDRDYELGAIRHTLNILTRRDEYAQWRPFF